MKTLFTLSFGIIIGLIATHYYHHSKTQYFDGLYSQYTQVNFDQLSIQKFEQKWLADEAWCFNSPTQNYCNPATIDNESNTSPNNQIVNLHQKLIDWYPKAKSSFYDIRHWAINIWEKQTRQVN